MSHDIEKACVGTQKHKIHTLVSTAQSLLHVLIHSCMVNTW